MKKAEADWILQIDIVEKGDKLEVRRYIFCFRSRPVLYNAYIHFGFVNILPCNQLECFVANYALL